MKNERQWFLFTENENLGPYLDSEIVSYLAEGRITGEWYIWKEGFPDWQQIKTVPEFQEQQTAPAEPAPEATVVSPVGLPESESGYFHLILTDYKAFDPNLVTAAACKALGVPRQDIIQRVQKKWGNFYRSNETEKLQKLCHGLNESGIPAHIVPAEEMRPIPSRQLAHKAMPTTGGLGVEIINDKVLIPYESIQLICLAQIQESVTGVSELTAAQKKNEDRGRELSTSNTLGAISGSILNSVLRAKRVSVTKTSSELRLDIITKSPVPSLQLGGKSFDYSFLGSEKEMNALLNLRKVALELIDKAPQAILNTGMRNIVNVSSSPGQILKAIENKHLSSFEAEEYWLLQLVS